MFGAIVGSVVGVISAAKSVLGGGTSDTPNTQRLDAIYQAALNEGPDGRSFAELKCWAGINDASVQRWNLDAFYRDKAASGYTTGCSSKPANVAYAQTKIAELNARWRIGETLATVGIGATGAAEKVYPGSTSGALNKMLLAEIGGVPTLFVFGLVVVGVILLVRHRRG